MRKRLIWWWKIIKQYLCNCGIHGVRYLVDDQYSYIERFFWLISCALCWVGCAIMIRSVVNYFIKYPIAVTAETMYLGWQTPFPAVSVCILTSGTMRKHFKDNPGSFSDLVSSAPPDTTGEQFLTLYDELKRPCSMLMQNCAWNNVKFNCCDEFRELRKSGLGYCLAINSEHIRVNGKSTMKYFVNRTVKYGDLFIDFVEFKDKKGSFRKDLQVYVHSNLRLPTVTGENDQIRKPKSGKTNRVELTVQSTFNEEGVQNVGVERRNCRFPNEMQKNSSFYIYSYTSCILEVMIQRMIKLCGCVNFYYIIPPGARACDAAGMKCLAANKSEIMPHLKKIKECLPDCGGTKLTMNNGDVPTDSESVDSKIARVHFTLLSHPTVRYRRYVVNDLLDVVVSVGSAVGLFMGASILSIFEIPYWLFVRRDRIS